MHSGNYVLILHTHLPWVLHHGNWPHGVDWLSEAVAECYIPLLNVFNDCLSEGIVPKVTLDISPILCEQLEHKDFKKIFIEYCEQKIKSAQEDRQNFKNWGYDEHHIWLTNFWEEWYTNKKEDYIKKYDSSIINGLKQLQDQNAIEIMTCGATHGYFPLLGFDKSINLQVATAVKNYKKYFGREPKGIWLPECAYRPSYEWQTYLPITPFNSKKLRTGVEQILATHGIKYFVTDEDLLKRMSPIGEFTANNKEGFVPFNSPNFIHKNWEFDKNPLRIYEVASSEKIEYGTAAIFTRHHDLSMQVWSGQIGYPAEPDYLDFHKKHFPSMHRYWRVTDSKADMMYKTLYHPDWTKDKIDKQSNHFIHNLENASNYYNAQSGKLSTVTTPFDTELFGHWWFEGPEFLRSVIKGLHQSPYVNMVTAEEQYRIINPKEIISIPEGSWGVNNDHTVWSNEENKWTWESIYNDELRFDNLYRQYFNENIDAQGKRILLQILKELLLLQSSDWQFLIYTESAKDYAEMRFANHHSDFNRLCDSLEKYMDKQVLPQNDLKYLEETEKRNSIFPELDLNDWKEVYS
ncbi:MAG TPA: DUF1957 domain-containing protein [Candidatus Kapabacteria bacterium]|nr:DUF1957 domain-containing protein [Candidatus Kapabacteria bacterium]